LSSRKAEHFLATKNNPASGVDFEARFSGRDCTPCSSRSHPNALNQSENHASLASRPENIMKPCSRCESIKIRRSSASLMPFEPASKAPTPKLSGVADYAAAATRALPKPACNMSSRRSQLTSCESHPGQPVRRLPRRAVPTSRLSNFMPYEFATSIKCWVYPLYTIRTTGSLSEPGC
jgi:hypothetical protein